MQAATTPERGSSRPRKANLVRSPINQAPAPEGWHGLHAEHARTINTAAHAVAMALMMTRWANRHRSGPAAHVLYIAGPITGRPDGNREAFRAAATQLRRAGFATLNPHDLPHMPDVAWADAMRLDMPCMLCCTGVALLPGWAESNGARREQSLAEPLGIPCKSVAQWLEAARGVDERAAA